MAAAQKEKDILLFNILDRTTKILRGLVDKIYVVELKLAKIMKTLAEQNADISGIAPLEGCSSSLPRRISSSSSCSCSISSISNCSGCSFAANQGSDKEDDDDDNDSIMFIDEEATTDADAATPNELLDKNIINDMNTE